MSTKLVLFLLFLAGPMIFAATDSTKTATMPKHGFVGVETCKMCHHTDKQGKQFDIWQNSKHAQAYKTLETDEANKIAKEKGFTTPAAKTPECLKCHVTGYNVEASLLGPKYKMEDGVQCETCHGAGADYKSLKVMKDKKLAVENGLMMHDDLKTFCATCHNPESPSYKAGEDFNKMWDMIKHPIPEAK